MNTLAFLTAIARAILSTVELVVAGSVHATLRRWAYALLRGSR